MKRFRIFTLVAAAVVFLSASCQDEPPHRPSVPQKTEEDDDPTGGIKDYQLVTKDGTLLRTSCADPSLVYWKGEFYLTMTGASNLALVHDEDLSKLTTSAHATSSNLIYQSGADKNVTDIWGAGTTINGTWSPELHYFSETDCPGHAGWYIVFGLRKENSANDSSEIRPVVIKSLGSSPAGPWGHPVTGVRNVSQRLLDAEGNPFSQWAVGMSFLRIPTGEHKGIYALWVDEVGRGEGLGKFYQRLRIARMKTPWQIDSEAATITQPTQDWEKKGASSKLPQVVEGVTAIYGKNGEVFLAYCGSGYWSDYGLGQLTLKKVWDDYADPLKTDSWIKYEDNPIFTSRFSDDLRGAGHAFFFEDAKGNRLMCYHSYTYVNGTKSSSRNAYVEPFEIDYSVKSATAPQGLIKFGIMKNGRTAPVTSSFQYYKAVK
ncbi:MAG: family 43 glycosylhydrolase [Bacteroidales bacterium]|nr:family 43 glycosylhydrolase [Bacteroidales bacterium]